MKGLYDKIQEAVDYIQNKTSTTPRFALVLGTGLGGMAGSIDAEATFSYGEIPHCVTATGLGHAGNLIVGSLGGKDVVAMQGRLHYYEGYSMQEITFPVRVMRALGAGEVVMSSAVGGMNPHLDRGDIVVLTDHMNLMGDNPLIGWNDDRLGERFPDMSEPYSQERRRFFAPLAVGVLHEAPAAAVPGRRGSRHDRGVHLGGAGELSRFAAPPCSTAQIIPLPRNAASCGNLPLLRSIRATCASSSTT